MIYEFEINEIEFKYRKKYIVIFLLITAIYFTSHLIDLFKKYSYELLGVSADRFKISTFTLILVFILLTFLYQRIFNKSIKEYQIRMFKDSTYCMTGIDKIHTKCFLKVNDDNLIIFSKNIENKIYYNEIQQAFFKNDNIVLFLKNRTRIIIPKTSKFEELSNYLKLKLEK